MISGPCFIKDEDGLADMITYHRYMIEILLKMTEQNLSRHEQLWFQQVTMQPTQRELASLHFANLFLQQIVSHFGTVPWPPRSPDLTVPKFFFEDT